MIFHGSVTDNAAPSFDDIWLPDEAEFVLGTIPMIRIIPCFCEWSCLDGW